MTTRPRTSSSAGTAGAELEQEGLSFAPESVARRFAFERTASTGGEFGFHGAFNLVRLLPPKRFLPLFRDIEPGVLTTRSVSNFLLGVEQAGVEARADHARAARVTSWRRKR